MITNNESEIAQLVRALISNQARMEARIYYLQCTVNAYVGWLDHPTDTELQECLESI